jgi:large repetitive protein
VSQHSLPALTAAFLLTSASLHAQIGFEPRTLLPARIVSPLDDSRLVTLKGNTHPAARPDFDKGAAPTDLPLERMQLVLRRSDTQQAELYALLDAQQDRRSASFHKWLKPEEFGRRFGLADSDLQVVTSWLESNGFQVKGVGKGRSVIEFSGTAGQVAKAFHTEIHKYVVRGEEHWANSTDPRIPEALAPVVAGIATLDDFKSTPMVKIAGKVLASELHTAPRPKTDLVGGKYALGPFDFEAIYNMQEPSIYSGGVTIAVIGLDMINYLDVFEFTNAFGLAQSPQIIVNGTAPASWANDDDLEGLLDTSWSLTIASGATVLYIASPPTNMTDGLTLSEQYAVDDDNADVITESYGYCEADLTAAHAQQLEETREQAAAQGITWVAASGDLGPYCDDAGFTAATLGPASVNGLASSPYVVAVGGTEFATGTNTSVFWNQYNTGYNAETALSYIPELAWNNSCSPAQCGTANEYLGASAGGPSVLYAKPAWQAGVAGIPNDGARDLPDVSFNASPVTYPYLLCYQGSCSGDTNTPTFYLVGGTSASTPAFAGVMARIVAFEKERQGAANYELYHLAAVQNYSQCAAYDPATLTTFPAATCIFNDITIGNTSVPGAPGYGTASGLYAAGAGYDLATGLGSINVGNLISAWNSLLPTTTTLAANPTTFVHGTPVSIQISVGPQTGSGTPTGKVSLYDYWGPVGQPVALVGGVASFSEALVAGSQGSYLWARYTGDTTYAESTSSPVIVYVTPEPTIVTGGLVTTAEVPNAFYLGGPYGEVALTAAANVAGRSGQGTPTGYVTVAVPLPQEPSVTLTINSQGEAYGTFPALLTPGQWVISTGYAGDPNFQPGVSFPQRVAITPAITITSMQPNIGSATAGQAVALTATVRAPRVLASGATPPTGTVTFLLNGRPLSTPVTASAATSGVGLTAVYTALALPSGANSITANYSGDANYAPSSTTQAATVNVVAQSPACQVENFTASPNPITIYDPPAVTTLSVSASCAFDIRSGSPSGALLASSEGNYPGSPLAVSSGPVATNGTTFYLQMKGNTTPQGTLQTVMVGVQSGSLACEAYSFSATPNPVIAPTLLGVTAIDGYASCPFDVRIGGPDGTLFTTSMPDGNGNYITNSPTGNWVSNDMRFVMQIAGDTTPQGTLASVTVPVLAAQPACLASLQLVTPRLFSRNGTGTVTGHAEASCQFFVSVGAPDGPIVSPNQGSWADFTYQVTGPTVFYMQMNGDETPSGTIATASVSVHSQGSLHPR